MQDVFCYHTVGKIFCGPHSALSTFLLAAQGVGTGLIGNNNPTTHSCGQMHKTSNFPIVAPVGRCVVAWRAG